MLSQDVILTFVALIGVPLVFAAVTRLLDRLVEASLVERCALEGDRRARRIELSEKAKGLLPQIDERFKAVEGAIEKGMSAAERKDLLKALKELTERAERT